MKLNESTEWANDEWIGMIEKLGRLKGGPSGVR